MAIEAVYEHPEDYDLELASRDVHDAPFWRELLRREQPREVLEIGCGTGRLTLPLSRLGATQGFRITGLDPEEAMIKRARMRATGTELGDALQFVQGDVRTLDLPTRFDVILMPYGAAHHLLSLDDQLAAWTAMRRHLHTGGLLCIDVCAPDMRTLARALEGTRRHIDLEARDPDGRSLQRTVASHYAPASQLATHAYVYDSTKADGSRCRYPSEFEMQIYFPREMQILCKLTGFTIERMVGSYEGEDFRDNSELMLTLARAID